MKVGGGGVSEKGRGVCVCGGGLLDKRFLKGGGGQR